MQKRRALSVYKDVEDFEKRSEEEYFAMFHKVVILLVLSVTVSHAKIESRIIGGDVASVGSATYLVSIQNESWVHVCAGAIIDTRWVLTSGTCAKNTNLRQVVPGVSILVDGRIPEVSYHISRAIVHPNFIEGAAYHDIGLIRTLQTFVYTTSIRAMTLATTTLATGSQLTMLGWDFSAKAPDSKVEEPSSYRLRSLTLTSITNTQCQKDSLEDVIIESTHLCGLRSTGKGSCYGDDGLVVINNGCIHGVVAGAPKTLSQCALGYPEVFTRVLSFNSWITAEKAKYP